MGMAQGASVRKRGTILVETPIANTLEMKTLLENEFEFQEATIYVILIRNNSATEQYRGVSVTHIMHQNSYYIFDRLPNATTTASTNWLFSVNANSIIEIYEIIA